MTTRYEDIQDLCLGDLPRRCADRCPDRTAIVAGDRRMTFREVEEAVGEFASGLVVMGIGKGDRVVIALPNSPELVIAFFGTARAGAIPAWVHPHNRREEIAPILGIADPRLAIVPGGGEEPTAEVLAARRGCARLRWIFSLRGEEGCHPYDDLRTAGRAAPLPMPRPDPREAFGMILFTSGSTGVPKGAPIRHDQAIRQALAYAEALQTTSDDVFLAGMPLCLAYPLVSTLVHAFVVQGTVVLMEEFDAGDALGVMEKERVTIQPGTPMHFSLEMDHAAFAGTDLGSLRAGLCSGYAPAPGLFGRVEDAMGIYLAHFWGSSEVGPGLIPPAGTEVPLRHETVGRPLDECEVKVVDAVTGEGVGPGEVGELLYRGWTVLERYWRDPGETMRHFTKDRFFKTGDLATVDEEGWVRIVGRVKEQINRAGMKIVPSEVERLILRDERVEEVGVVGIPDSLLGEKICACAVLREGESITLQEIRSDLADDLAPYKLPDVLRVIDVMPRIPGSTKPRRHGPGGLVEIAEGPPGR